MSECLRRRCAIFAHQSLIVSLARELAQLRITRHLGSRQLRIQQSEPVEHRVMKLRLDMRQPAEEGREMLAAWHLLLPQCQPLLRLGVKPLGADIAPERGVLTFCNVVRVDKFRKSST